MQTEEKVRTYSSSLPEELFCKTWDMQTVLHIPKSDQLYLVEKNIFDVLTLLGSKSLEKNALCALIQSSYNPVILDVAEIEQIINSLLDQHLIKLS